MMTFGKRLRECREAKGFSQQALAKQMSTSYTVVGKYEHDEMTLSIEVARNLAKLSDTNVGYLLGETDEVNVLKDPGMLMLLCQRQINHISFILLITYWLR